MTFEDDDYGIRVRAESLRLNGQRVVIRTQHGEVQGRLDISKVTNGVLVFEKSDYRPKIIYYGDILEMNPIIE